jgi:hypothetical protein
MSQDEAMLHYDELQQKISTLVEPADKTYRLVIGQ